MSCIGDTELTSVDSIPESPGVAPLTDDFEKYVSETQESTDLMLLQQHLDKETSGVIPMNLLGATYKVSYTNSSHHQNKITTNPLKNKVNKPAQQKKNSRFKPCEGCRKRRTKCTVPENMKICLECSKRNMDCVFQSNGKNFSKSAYSDYSICDNCKHRRTACVVPRNSNICTECSLRDLQCKFSDVVNNNAKIRTNIPIRDYDNYNGPTIMKKTLSLQGPKSSKFMGPSSIIEKNLMSNNDNMSSGSSPNSMIKKEQYIIESGLKLRKINNDTIFKIINDNEEFIKLSYSQVDEIEKIVYPYGLTLANLYFKVVHPLLPIVSKPVFLEKYSRTHREFDPLLLATFYLHALNWWHLDENLKNKPKPNYEKLERFTLVLYSENLINLPPKFSTCQALLLLMNYNFHQLSKLSDRNDAQYKSLLKSSFFNIDSWKVISQIVTVAEELGLNFNSDDWTTIPNWERKIRKIVTWTIILFDKIYSLLEFRPSRINPDNWILNEVELTDFKLEDREEVFIEKISPEEQFLVNYGRDNHVDQEDELSIFGNLIFAKMIHLSYHINDVLNEIYNFKSLKFDDFDKIMEKSEVLQTNLSNWFKTLPLPMVDLKNFNTGIISPASLCLNYYTVDFLIYRRVINSFIETMDMLNSADIIINQFDDQFQRFKKFFKKLVQDLQHFNNNFINCLDLQRHFTQNFWYTDPTKSFILTGIVKALLIKLSKEEYYLDDEYDTQYLINSYLTYRQQLQRIATVFPQAGLSLIHLDSIIVMDGKMGSFSKGESPFAFVL